MMMPGAIPQAAPHVAAPAVTAPPAPAVNAREMAASQQAFINQQAQLLVSSHP